MKTVLFLICVLFMTSVFANSDTSTQKCLMAFTKSENESSLFTVDHDDVWGPDHLASSIRAIRKLANELGCVPGSISFGKGPEGRSHSDCNQLASDRLNSVVCYVESNLGYFVVNRTYNDKLNILFNHWD